MGKRRNSKIPFIHNTCISKNFEKKTKISFVYFEKKDEDFDFSMRFFRSFLCKMG